MIAVKDGIDYATDMDIEISHPVQNIADGMYLPHGFDKEKLRKKESLPLDDFPFSDEPGDPVGSIVVKTNALKFVARAQSTEDARYYLNGICFTGQRMVATDGHRLNLAHLGVEVPAGAHIIPRGAIKIALSILSQFKKYDEVAGTFRVYSPDYWTFYPIKAPELGPIPEIVPVMTATSQAIKKILSVFRKK